MAVRRAGAWTITARREGTRGMFVLSLVADWNFGLHVGITAWKWRLSVHRRDRELERLLVATGARAAPPLDSEGAERQ